MLKELINAFMGVTIWANSSTAMLSLIRSDLTSASTFLENPFFKTAYDAFVPIAIQIAIIYLLLGFIEEATSGKLTTEVMVKGFIKLAFTVILIQNSFEILKYIANFGDALCEAIIGENRELNISFRHQVLTHVNPWEFAGRMSTLIAPFIKLTLLLICSKLVIFGRSIELGVYLSLAPLAFPSVVSDGLDGDAFKYVKKFAAICIQGVIIALTVIVGTMLNQQSVFPEIDLNAGAFTSNFSGGIILYLCLLFMLFQSRRIANEVMGIQ